MTLLNLQDAMNIYCIVANHFPNHVRRVAQGVVLVILVVFTNISISINNIILVLLALLCISTNSMHVTM